jgi:hypothetical protein
MKKCALEKERWKFVAWKNNLANYGKEILYFENYNKNGF